MQIQVPDRKYHIGDIVRITDHDIDDQAGIHVVSGVKLIYLKFFRSHVWEYCLEDKFSSSGWFDEDKIEAATPQTEAETNYITGGNVPFRDMATCPACDKLVVAELLDCPHCSADLPGEITTSDISFVAAGVTTKTGLFIESPDQNSFHGFTKVDTQNAKRR
jgi:hypothetical protein